MFKKGQKIYGFVLEENEWKEFNSWELRSLSDVEYKIWKDKYQKRIHVNRNLDSPLIFFNKRHGTFSYFSSEDRVHNGNSGPVTLSHLLRQKVIASKTEAIFSISKRKINKNDTEKEFLKIKIKSVIEEEEIILPDGSKIRPDLTITFEEPAYLALKWNNKILIEVVEKNETRGKKIEAYRDLGFGVLEIPYSPHFDIFNGRKFSEITQKEAKELERKIQNFFKKSIWADLIVNPTSQAYLEWKSESEIHAQNQKLKELIRALKKQNDRLVEQAKSLKTKIKEITMANDELLLRQKAMSDRSNNCHKQKQELQIKINTWNKTPVWKKILCGLKIR